MAVIGRFLASVGHKIWALVGPVLVNSLITRIQVWIEANKRRREIQAAAKAEREATEKAQTPEEREDAHDQNRRV